MAWPSAAGPVPGDPLVIPLAAGMAPASRASSIARTSLDRRRNSLGSGGGAWPESMAACWLLSPPGWRGRNTGAPWLARCWAQPRKLSGASQSPWEITTSGRLMVPWGRTTFTSRIPLLPETGIFTTLVWIAWGPGRNWLFESLKKLSTIDGLGY
jgi:hypothetical protein